MDEQERIVTVLGKVLKMLEKQYDSPPNETGVQRYTSGVIVIIVKNEPKFWFFDEQELADWLRSMENGIH